MVREPVNLNSLRYLELALIVLTGAGHVLVELAWGQPASGKASSGLAEQFYNVAAAGLWSGYVLWRLAGTQGTVARLWGFRRDNFFETLRVSAGVLLIAAIPLILIGHFTGRLTFPPTFFVSFLLYPLYGVAQQFALQALITRNLRGFVTSRWARTFLVASLFSAAHFPNAALMGLVFLLGLAFTWIYEDHPNLWALGIVHGILGALAYYFVLGLDPGAEILEAVQRLLDWHVLR